MDFVGSGNGGVGGGGLGSDGGPILYSESNRTSAIDDIRSVVLYVFIITIFLGFFLILPGIRNEKFPTFLCITTSLVVTSIILISLFGTTWHVGQAPISAAYKAFSRDRIQGELSVKIGLQSVNITLRAHKYYILDATNGPIIMENMAPPPPALPAMLMGSSSSLEAHPIASEANESSFLDTSSAPASAFINDALDDEPPSLLRKRSTRADEGGEGKTVSKGGQKYTIKRVNVDINYNERFYWIGPNQMRQEHLNALERGLPFPILTVVEYLSQDDGGFSWSRQYRLAGYYSYICLWLSLSVCILMFILHCAAPKYGIYAMQVLGCLLLFTNFTYATLVPRGERKLVIPFEGQSLTFEFGWNFWIVLMGGCLSLVVGTIIVIIDCLFPNFIFTTVLDVDFDSHHSYYKRRCKNGASPRVGLVTANNQLTDVVRPPFYDDNDSESTSTRATSSSSSPVPSSNVSRSSRASSVVALGGQPNDASPIGGRLRARHQLTARDKVAGDADVEVKLAQNSTGDPMAKSNSSHAASVFTAVLGVDKLVTKERSDSDLQRHQNHVLRGSKQTTHHHHQHHQQEAHNKQKKPPPPTTTTTTTTSSSENNHLATSSVVDMASVGSDASSDTTRAKQMIYSNFSSIDHQVAKSNHQRHQPHHHYGRSHANKNVNLKSTDHQPRREQQTPLSRVADDEMIASDTIENVRL